MKADLTRDTFHPFKHFDRVLMQQGRVQLDADCNEQAAILLHYMRTLAADLIGPAGGPEPNLGFGITPLVPVATADFQIGFGDYYVDGLLCQADFMPTAISPSSTSGVFQVLNWRSDFELTPIPHFEVFDDTPGTTKSPVAVTISNPLKSSSQVTVIPGVAGSSFSNFPNPKLRRCITYLHQPDYVYSTTAGAISPPPLPSGECQIYLDVWERVITYAEDDSIREVALGGPDTAARTKLVWQVKWVQAPPGANAGGECATFESLYGQLQPANRGWLQAMAKQGSPSTDPCIVNPNASYTGPENQLYRVEINRAGGSWNGADPTDSTSATFKWSRENGSAIYPIASGGGTASVVVETLGRDDRFGLTPGEFVEVQDDRSVLMNLPGNLLTVQSIDSSTLIVSLGGTPDALIGNDESLHPLLRRWDQAEGDPAEGGLTLANDNAAFVQEGVWLTLEDGVQIRFQPGAGVSTPTQPNLNQYRTGDYWLIPARTATGDVEWPKVTDAHGNPETDAQGNPIPIALPPHGITHHYAPLAVASVTPNGVTPQPDCRSSFNPLAVPLADK
ncbi:MAG: DUF6519 domain-containing protein [Candidatus Sulfotelmatobacter sp.]